MDLGIKSFQLLQTTDGTTEDNSITLNEGKKFDLTVTVTASGTESLGGGGSRHFTVMFYVSDDDVWDENDWQATQNTFEDSAYDIPMSDASNPAAPVDQDLDWDIDGQESLLVVDDFSAGHYCTTLNVYLIARVQHEDPGKIATEPDDLNDYMAVKINMSCAGGTYIKTHTRSPTR